MTASGLGATDLGAEDAVGGISREFYQEIAKYYKKKSNGHLNQRQLAMCLRNG